MQTTFVGPVRYMSCTLPPLAVRLTVSSPPGMDIASSSPLRPSSRSAAAIEPQPVPQASVKSSTPALVGYRLDVADVYNFNEADVRPARELLREPQGAAKRAEHIVVALIPIGHENYRVGMPGSPSSMYAQLYAVPPTLTLRCRSITLGSLSRTL